MTEPATTADLPAIRALLGEAYADDPLSVWIFADARTRKDACAAWFALFAEQYVSGAQATVVRESDEIVAVALWRLPEDPPLSSGGTPSIAGLLAALVGAERAGEVGAGLHAIGALRVSEPHTYLNFLAVAADRRRRGLGRLVLEPLFIESARKGLPVVLETTNPANHAFYEALGFAETGRVGVGADGPLVRALRLA